MSALCFVIFLLLALASVSGRHRNCDIVLPQYSLSHAEVDFDSNSFSYRFTCHPGYKLIGNREIYCVSTEWSSPPPRCTKDESSSEVCEELPAPENGRVNCDKEPLSVGKKCHFNCNEGYELKGLTMRSCMASLTWSGKSPRCIYLQSTFCPIPPNLIYGTVVGCSSIKLPRVGESCSYRCKDGYELHGPSQLICGLNGRYADPNGNDVSPKCVEISSNQNAEAISTNEEKNNFEPRNHYKIEADKKDPCANHSCHQFCRVEEGRPQCRCYRGYLLNTEDQRTCNVYNGPPIHTTKRPSYVSYRPNPCKSNNGGCAHRCSLTKERNVNCLCYSGFILEDDKRSCKIRGATIIPVQPVPFNPCSINNGGCYHKCNATRNSGVQCSCKEGFVLHENGKACIDIDECLNPQLNICEQKCYNKEGTFGCYCESGFKLIDGYKCQDIDECSFEHLNNCHHLCSNSEGSFTCFCKPGYILTDGHKCKGCGQNKFWSFELEGCVDCPLNSHTLSDGSQSISNCLCDAGFTGSPGDYIPCEDIDECSLDNFGCSHTCHNIPGAVYCSCPRGFMLDKDNKTCIDIDECKTKNGGCEGDCVNEHGSFRCICLEGYKKSNKDQYSCDDVDECENNNGGCQHKCINYRGGYHCDCEVGNRLDSEQKNCIEVQCPVLPIPPHSKMSCKHQKQKLEEIDSYPISTVCNFTCDKGFKNAQQSNIMECQGDGAWSGRLPQCKSQFCPPLDVPENGAVHPASCSKRGNKVKQRCTFSCHPGYVISGLSIFQCKNNLTWDVKTIPVCQPEKIQPRIQCPEDVVAVLLLGKKTQVITLSEPITNMEKYEIRPANIQVGTPFEFQAGVTKVIFNAFSSQSNKTTRCVTTVTVLDKEPPLFEYCPAPIKIEDSGADGAFVTWEEPVATDNVEVETLYSIMEPNTTLASGSHVVEYVARDAAGNTATCSFDITITRMKCPILENPEHGDANCVDWFQGKFCQPECEDGYMRNPDHPAYYSCDDSGIWEPTEVISECLKFVPLTSSTCPDQFELKTNDETSENVCIQCSSNTSWSAASRKCEDKKQLKDGQ